MAGIREANRRLGAAERIEEMVVVNMFEVEEAEEEESKFPTRRRHEFGKRWFGKPKPGVQPCNKRNKATIQEVTLMGTPGASFLMLNKRIFASQTTHHIIHRWSLSVGHYLAK